MTKTTATKEIEVQIPEYPAKSTFKTGMNLTTRQYDVLADAAGVMLGMTNGREALQMLTVGARAGWGRQGASIVFTEIQKHVLVNALQGLLSGSADLSKGDRGIAKKLLTLIPECFDTTWTRDAKQYVNEIERLRKFATSAPDAYAYRWISDTLNRRLQFGAFSETKIAQMQSAIDEGDSWIPTLFPEIVVDVRLAPSITADGLPVIVWDVMVNSWDVIKTVDTLEEAQAVAAEYLTQTITDWQARVELEKAETLQVLEWEGLLVGEIEVG